MADDTLPPLPQGYERAPQAQPNLPALPPGYERPAAKPKPGMWESFGRGAVEGGTFGLDYKLGMDKERREESRATNPWTHFLGEIVGGAAPMAAAAVLPTGVGQAAAAGRAAQMAGRGLRLARSAFVPGEIGTTAQALGQGAKLGATYGAASGAGHAEVDPNASYPEAALDRLTGAGLGGAEGALFGTALGGLGRGVYRFAQGVGTHFSRAVDENAPGGRGAIVAATKRLENDRVTPQQIMDNIRAEFPDATQTTPGGPGAPIARRFWGSATNRQPWTAEQVEEVVGQSMLGRSAADISTALQPPAGGIGPGQQAVQTLLDELAQRHLGPLNMVDRVSMIRTGSGENTQMGMRVAAATPGEATSVARESLLERQLGTNGRLHQALDRVVGTTDYDGAAAAHNARMDTSAQRLYGLAEQHEQPFNLNPTLDAWRSRFANGRGTIPDAVNSAIDAFATPNANWQQGLANALRRPQPGAATPSNAAPVGLSDFMLARQGLTDKINREYIETPQGLELSQFGKTLARLKTELTNEVRRTNPDWAVANDVFREGAAGNDALKAGAHMSLRLNSGSREGLAELAAAQTAETRASAELSRARSAIFSNPNLRRAPTPAEIAAAPPQAQAALARAEAIYEAAQARQELFRVGFVRAISDQMMNRGETEDLVRQMLFPGARQIITRVLGNQAPQFINQLRAEAAMLRTYRAQFGSQTTPLAQAIKEDSWAPRFEVSMTNPMSWLNGALRLAQEHSARTINANRNRELMGIYTETDPLRQLQHLRAMRGLHRTRSRAGNWSGMPVVGSAALISESVVGDQLAPGPTKPRQ
jgi:voltage-gated potassium channel Kch